MRCHNFDGRPRDPRPSSTDTYDFKVWISMACSSFELTTIGVRCTMTSQQFGWALACWPVAILESGALLPALAHLLFASCLQGPLQYLSWASGDLSNTTGMCSKVHSRVAVFRASTTSTLACVNIRKRQRSLLHLSFRDIGHSCRRSLRARPTVGRSSLCEHDGDVNVIQARAK